MLPRSGARRGRETPIRLAGILCALLVLSRAPSEAATYVVDRLTDANPSGGGEGANFAGDLRFALINAQTGDGVSITVTGSIDLAAVLPPLTRNICIKGPGARLLTVHGIGGTVFAVGTGATVAVAALTISGGGGNGGGIFNQGTLTLNNAVIRGNTAGDPTNGDGTGAGIWNYLGASLTLNNSTVTDNTVTGNLSYAPSRGGGIANDGNLVLNNSTVAGNSSVQGFGGGIANSLGSSSLILNHSTISGNSSPGTSSGGIDNRGTLIAANSIVDGNADGDLSGNLTSHGYNLFGSTNGGGFDPTDLLDIDPMLGPLQDNGGPTPTMAPLPGSPAVDRIAGVPGVDFLTADQRGIPRPQGGLADSGAVEAEQAPQVVGVFRLHGKGSRPQASAVTEVTPKSSAQTVPRGPVVLADSASRPAPRALNARSSGDPCSPD
jgi:hypothetical protein